MTTAEGTARATRVLEVLPRSGGGIGYHVAEVVAALDGRDGLEIDVAGPAGISAPMPKRVATLDIPRGARGHGAAVRRLRSLLRAGEYRVVHAHGIRAGIDAGLAARVTGTRSVVTVHNLVRPDIVGAPRARLLGGAERVAVRLADVVLAPALQIAEHLRATAPRAAARIEVVHLRPAAPQVRRPRAEVRAELGLVAGELLIVAVARLVPQKALDVLLRALRRLPQRFVLAVAGEGRLRAELSALADELGVASRVRWLGHRDDVGDLVAAADVFCLSSVWEAVALAAQEAVQLGTPVVATRVGGMEELIDDRVSGRLVPAGDNAALAAALEEVAGSATGAEYARVAQARYDERFSRARTMDAIASAYLRLSSPADA